MHGHLNVKIPLKVCDINQFVNIAVIASVTMK